MSDANKELVDYLEYARIVTTALPVDDAAERVVSAIMPQRNELRPSRKLTRKVGA